MSLNRIVTMIMMLLLLTAGSTIAQDIQRTQTQANEKEIISMATPEIVAARAFRTKKKYDEAIQSYELAIERHPNAIYVSIAYAEIGDCYKTQGINAKASEYYKKAIPLFEKVIALSDREQAAYRQANRSLVGIYIQLENSERAIGYLNQLGEFEGLPIFEMVELGAYWMSLAEIYEKQEKWKDAVSTYRQALEHFTKAGGPLPNMSRVHVKLAACYKKLQNWKAAINEVQKQKDMAERYLKDHPDLQESKREIISQGIEKCRTDISQLNVKAGGGMQGMHIFLIVAGIVIVIGILSLLLMKRSKQPSL